MDCEWWAKRSNLNPKLLSRRKVVYRLVRNILNVADIGVVGGTDMDVNSPTGQFSESTGGLGLFCGSVDLVEELILDRSPELEKEPEGTESGKVGRGGSEVQECDSLRVICADGFQEVQSPKPWKTWGAGMEEV